MTHHQPDITTIVAEAIDIASEEERQRYLDQLCLDAPLRQQVERLIANHFQAGSFLESPAANLVITHDHVTASEFVDSQIGPYKLLERIGEGGMGVVYVAEQIKPVRRKVALKIIKPGMDTREVISRFEAERQALALMNHPNIAKVLDGGSTEVGRPYFVMELVKGVPITEFCDVQQFGTRQRLELFITVCQAVQHAHQKGVIHRDLKPSNVLVEMHDVLPVPKVIDFGVAKAIGQQLSDHSLYTGFAQLVGTPLYMSPEQAGQSSIDIDTRSDVYSLGVLLYEMLTGHTPFDREMLRTVGADEMRRIIREVDPPRPSARVTTLQAAALSTVSQCRGIEPRKLSQHLRGELDWIVMKALEKDRTRRYETASGLARDLQRFLADEPVEARPPSTSYRLKKLLRRNKGPAIATVLVALTLVGGVIGTTWGMFLARHASRAEGARAESEARERQRAELAEKSAIAEASISKAVNQFLQDDLLGMTGASKQLGGAIEPDPDIKLRTLLDRAQANVDARFAEQPQQRAAVQNTLAYAYFSIGRYTEAAKLWTELLGYQEQSLGPEHPDTLTSMNNLARTFQANGQYDKAITLNEQTLGSRRKILGPEHPDTLVSMNNLALAFHIAGQYAKAITLHKQAFELQVKIQGPRHPQTLVSMNDLATAHQDAGHYREAITLNEQSLELHRNVLGLKHPHTVTAIDNLGSAYRNAGQYVKAIDLYEQAHELRREVLGGQHPETVHSLNNLAVTYCSAGDHEKAITMFKETQELAEKVLGLNHPHTLTLMNNLSMAYVAAGDYDKCIELSKLVLDLRLKALGPEHPGTCTAMNNLAVAYQAKGQYDMSITLFAQALELDRKVLGPEHPNTLASMNNLGRAFQIAGQYDKAISLNEQSLDLQRKTIGAEHPHTIACMGNLAVAYSSAGQHQKAIKLHEQAIDLNRKLLGPDHPSTLTAINNLAMAFQGDGQYNKAIQAHERVLDAQCKLLGPEHPATLTSLNNLALACQASGRNDKAKELFEQALELRRKTLGSQHPLTLQSMNNLGAAYYAERDYNKAITLHEQTLELRIRILGTENPDTLQSMNNLAVAYSSAGQHSKALPMLERSLELKRVSLGSEHVSTVESLKNLAMAYQDAGHYARASSVFEKVVELTAKTRDLEHPLTFQAMNHLATALRLDGQFDRAVALNEQTLELRRKILGPEHPDTITSMINVAVTYWYLQKLDKSIPLFEEIVRLRTATLGREHAETFRALGNLGVNYKDAGRLSEAVPLLEQAWSQRQKVVSVAFVAEHLADAYAQLGQPEKAEVLLCDAVDQARRDFGIEHPQYADSLAALGRSLLRQKKPSDAESVIRICLAIRGKTEPDSWRMFNYKSMLGAALLEQEKYTEAESSLLEGYKGLKQCEEKIPPVSKSRLTEALERLVDLYTAWNKPDEAARWRAELPRTSDNPVISSDSVQKNTDFREEKRGECSLWR